MTRVLAWPWLRLGRPYVGRLLVYDNRLWRVVGVLSNEVVVIRRARWWHLRALQKDADCN